MLLFFLLRQNSLWEMLGLFPGMIPWHGGRCCQQLQWRCYQPLISLFLDRKNLETNNLKKKLFYAKQLSIQNM